MMSPWRELNAFHEVMAALWHPASEKNDLKPLRERVGELVSRAEAWKTSKAPAMPAGCGAPRVLAAIDSVRADAAALSSMVTAGGDDARLKASLAAMHARFEVAEKACPGHGEHK